MARVTVREEKLAGELGAGLADDAAPMASLLEGLRGLLDADRVLVYGVRLGLAGYEVQLADGSGFRQSQRALQRTLARSFRGVERPWAAFDPLAPERRQRNRAVVLPPPAGWRGPAAAQLLTRLGVAPERHAAVARRMERLNAEHLPRLELADRHVCRAVLCDGDRLLAFVGAFRGGPFGERERLLLSRVLPALQARLGRDRARRGAARVAVLAAALVERLERPSFVIGRDGEIHLANQEGWALLAAEPAILGELRAGGSARFSHEPLPGADGAVLVTDRAAADLAARARALSRRWRLTPSQAAVLTRVVAGAATKRIADELGLSVRTVEYRLTQLFRRSRTETRAELTARFWSG